jgi:hypothetical protein
MNLELSLNGSVYAGEFIKVENQYFRIPHDPERDKNGNYEGGWNKDMVRDNAKIKPIPEVFRLYPDQTTSLDCKWIKFWRGGNPLLDREHFELLLDNRWMLCNGTGWPGRYNCLTGELSTNPNNPYQPPSFHAALINGGATVGGTVIQDNLYLNTLIISDPVPGKDWWEKNPDKWYYATTISGSGNITYTTFTGMDGNRQPLRIPILTNKRVYIPLRELHKLSLNFFPPNPLWKPF